MWRESERKAANCRGSSIVAKFAPEISFARYHVFLFPPSDIPSTLSSSSSSRYCDSNYFSRRKDIARIVYYCFPINGTILREKKEERKGRLKGRGFVIMVNARATLDSTTHVLSARNKPRTLVSRERIELGMQRVKQPLFSPSFQPDIVSGMDFIKKRKKKKKKFHIFYIIFCTKRKRNPQKFRNKIEIRLIARERWRIKGWASCRRRGGGGACQPFNSCGFGIRNNVSRFNYDRSSELLDCSAALALILNTTLDGNERETVDSGAEIPYL